MQTFTSFFYKKLSENIPYGSSTAEQTIETKNEFYIYYNGALTQVKKLNEFPAIFSHRRADVENYLKKNSKGNSLAEQFTPLVNFYNNLQ